MTRTLGIAALGCLLCAGTVQAQTDARYRDFALGGNLASVAALAGLAPSDAKTVHLRPANLQDLQWRRPYTDSGGTTGEPVQQIAFSFYNDKLFRLVVDYDRDRTEGMTDADMVDAISVMYGATVKPVTQTNRAAAAPIEDESRTRIARWGNADFSAVLYRSRSSYAPTFRMIVTLVKLDALARSAEAQALRLDERDAPQRRLALEKKQADEGRAAQEKARLANKAAFRP